MTLSEVAVRRPVFITMVTMAIMVLGVVAYTRLPTDLYPDVSFPFVTVTTVYPGASPADIETQLTKKIEDAVVSIAGLDALQSRSFDGFSQVICQFRLSTDLHKAATEVREKVAAMRATLPAGVKEPVVSRVDLGALPILTMSAAAPIAIDRVRRIAEDEIKPALEQLDGVAEVRVKGGLEREIGVELDQARLEALHLSPLTVLEQLKSANLTVPGGRIEKGGEELPVRTAAEFVSLDEVSDLVVATGARGSHVRLGDVAVVSDGFKDVRTMVRTNGEPAVALEVIKQTGSNTVTVAKAVRKKLAALSLPQGYEVRTLFDSSKFIEANAHEVNVALWFGGLMAVLIILIFMMDVRSTLISAVALPTSVVGTFFCMYLLGFSLNMMTLLGLSLAIGLLIDDAVVVRENIFKHLEHGESPFDAAVNGTREVQLAVLATTLTIVAVFVPVAFMDGIVGQFFKQFGLTVTSAVLLSLWVAFTLDPMLSSRFSKTRAAGDTPRWARPLAGIFTAIDTAYARAIAWVMRHRVVTVALAVGAFVFAQALTRMMGSDFLPAEDRGQAIVHLDYPVSTALEETARRSLRLEQAALKLPFVQSVFAEVGQNDESNRVRWRVTYAPKEERSVSLEDLKRQLRALLATDDDLGFTVLNPPNIEGLGEWSPIMLHITGPDLGKLAELDRTLRSKISAVPGVAEIDSSMRARKADVRIELNREALAERGLPAATVGLAVRVAINGEEAGDLRLQEKFQNERGETFSRSKEVPIRVRLRAEDRQDPALLRNFVLPGIDGSKLGDVATLGSGSAPSVIERYNRERKFTLSVTPYNRALTDVVEDIERVVAGEHLPAAYGAVMDGDAKQQKESSASMVLALFLAVVFIYLVLAAQFESFLHPFTIMLSLPLAMVGAWMALFLGGFTLSLSSSIGVILLMGLVTKNAILLVDSALTEERAGKSAEEAIAIAGKKRLRPILMTSAAMVLGMLPTAFGHGAGSEFRGPMAVAVIGGVVTSTLLTLVVVPIVYVWLEQIITRVSRTLARRAALDGAEQ